MARPTKYNRRVQSLADEYVDGGWRDDEDVVIPTEAGLALILQVTRETVENWARDPSKPKFFLTISKLRVQREHLLANGGLSGKFQPRISQFLLSANHNYREKTEQQIDSNITLQSLDDDALDAKIKALTEAANAGAN